MTVSVFVLFLRVSKIVSNCCGWFYALGWPNRKQKLVILSGMFCRRVRKRGRQVYEKLKAGNDFEPGPVSLIGDESI